MSEVAGWRDDGLTVAVLMRGDVDPEDLADWEIPLLLRDDGRVAAAFDSKATPGALLVDTTGRVASPLRNGALAIRELVGSAIASPTSAAPRPLVAGQPAPFLQLATNHGHPITLAQFGGRLTVVAFVDGTTGEHVMRQLRDRPDGGAPVLVVTIGGRHTLGEHDAIDPDGMTARAFGVTTTPAGVLVDATGRISAFANGGEELTAMLRRADMLVQITARPRGG
jgi:hypothetical protein